MNYKPKNIDLLGIESPEEIFLLSDCDRRLLENPRDIQALIEKGFLCGVEPGTDSDEAEKALGQAIKLEPTNVETYFWLARTIHFVGDSKRAKKILKMALKINPDRADCLVMLADESSTEESIKLLKKAAKLEPTWIWPRLWLSNHLIEKNDFDQAGKILKHTYEIFKNSNYMRPKSLKWEYYDRCITGKSFCKQADFDSLFAKLKEAQSKHQKK